MKQELPLRFIDALEQHRFGELGIYPVAPESIFTKACAESPYIKNKIDLLQKQLAGGSKVYASSEHSIHAQASLQRFFNKYVPGNCGSKCSLKDGDLLWSLSLSVCEDICLLAKVDGQYILSAGSLCAPSVWSLSEKMGKTLRGMHQPVPEINKQQGRAIDRFIEKLVFRKYYERFNWGLKTVDTLAIFPGQCIPVPKSFEEIYLRIERQVLFRLRSTDVVFTIHVMVEPLFKLYERYPQLRPALKKSYCDMSSRQRQYKQLDAYWAFL